MGSGPREWLFKIGTQRYFSGLHQYMKNDSATGKGTTMSPKNGQENLKIFTRSAVFIETSQNMYLLTFKWHFVMFEYYHIPKNPNSAAKLISQTP